MKSIGETLRELRKQNNLQQFEVVALLNKMGLEINKQKISRWETNKNNPTIPQFIALCKLYGVKDIHKVFGQNDYSELVYDLNKEGREKLEDYKQLLIASGKYAPHKAETKIVPFPRRTAPLYDIGASAGTGQFLDSNHYEMIEVPNEVPADATYALHVCGNSMEPTLFDGQIIWVHQQPTLNNGEIGIFYLDGEAFVKEYCCNENGVSLISHNDEYDPIPVNAHCECKIYGKVVFPI